MLTLMYLLFWTQETSAVDKMFYKAFFLDCCYVKAAARLHLKGVNIGLYGREFMK